MFVLPTKKEKRGEGQHIVENWVMDENNDKRDVNGKLAGGRVQVNPADRRKVGEPEDSADWVAVRDQNNDIVHIKASQLPKKPREGEEIGDITKKGEEGKELTEEEKTMKVELEAMDKELAEINKDDGAVIDPNAVETDQTRRAEGKRLQEMRERLKELRNTKDDEAFRRMETKLAKAQLKHDHRELAPDPDGSLKVDDHGMFIARDAPHRPPAVERGLLGGNDPGLSGPSVSGLRRRRSSVYPLGTQASHLKIELMPFVEVYDDNIRTGYASGREGLAGYGGNGQRGGPYYSPPPQSQAAPSQMGSRRPDNGSVAPSHLGAYGDRDTLAGPTLDPGHSNTPQNGISGQSIGPNSQAPGVNDNNVSNKALRPEDSQSQFGMEPPEEQIRQRPETDGNNDPTPPNPGTGNVLFELRSETTTGGPESLAAMSNAETVGPGAPSSQAGGLQERLGDRDGITERRPITETGNADVDSWMAEAQKALDYARKCAREPFTDKRQHAAWLGKVRGQVESLESRNQDFPPDLEARCNEKTKEIRDFMDSVTQWPLAAQPTGEHVEREDRIEVQSTSKRPPDARTEAGPGDDRTQRDNQAAGTRPEETINHEPTSRGDWNGEAVPPPEANHLDRTHEQRESHTAHDSLMPAVAADRNDSTQGRYSQEDGYPWKHGVKEDNQSHQPPPPPRRKGTPDAYANGSDQTRPIDPSATNRQGADHVRTDEGDGRASEGPPDPVTLEWLKDFQKVQADVKAKLSESVPDTLLDRDWLLDTINAVRVLAYRLECLSSGVVIKRYSPVIVKLKQSLYDENDKIILSRQATGEDINAGVNRSAMKQTTQERGESSGVTGRNTGERDVSPPELPANANHRKSKGSESLSFASLLMLRHRQLRGCCSRVRS
jgi:hypothetical protein